MTAAGGKFGCSRGEFQPSSNINQRDHDAQARAAESPRADAQQAAAEVEGVCYHDALVTRMMGQAVTVES